MRKSGAIKVIRIKLSAQDIKNDKANKISILLISNMIGLQRRKIVRFAGKVSIEIALNMHICGGSVHYLSKSLYFKEEFFVM